MYKNDDDHNYDSKNKQLEQYRRQNTGPGKKMNSDSGFKIPNDRWSLRAGKRGPLLMEDSHFYRKQSRFNRERIPEKGFMPGDLVYMVILNYINP